MKATEVTAGLAESNGSLLPGLWLDSLHVTCGLTACTPGSAPGPTLGNEYGKTLPLPYCTAVRHSDFAFLRLLFDVRLSHLNITYIHTYVVQNIHIVVFVSYRTARRRAVTTVARHRAAGAR